MCRIQFDDLLYDDSGSYLFEGRPFSGVAYDCFPDGAVRSEAQFVNGRQLGRAREWHENGNVKSDGEFLGDVAHGAQTEYYSSGRPKRKSVFEFGICLESVEWSEQGLVTNRTRLEATDPANRLLTLQRSIWSKKMGADEHHS